jgi:small subunit ribosomal protein S17
MADTPETPENDAPRDEQAAQEEQAVAPIDATTETPAAEEPAEAPAAEEEAHATEGTEEAEAQPVAEAAAEAPAEPSGDEASEAAPAAPAEELSPKERRRRERSRHVGKARKPRSPEERHAERLAERTAKAGRRRAVRARLREKRRERGGASGAAASAATPAVHEPSEPATGVGKLRQGVVVSDKPDKTIVVRISSTSRHRRYEKIVRSSRTLHAHDENNDAHEGDVVRLIESRPLSRTKRWRLVEVLERAR